MGNSVQAYRTDSGRDQGVEKGGHVESAPLLTALQGVPAANVCSRSERIEALQATLPEHYEPYTDKYFLRSKDILQSERLNPYVRAQVFIRKGPGVVQGLDEAIAILNRYSDLIQNGGKIYALRDGDQYEAGETLMVIEGYLQDMIEFETLYLGVLSRATTAENDQISHVDLDAARSRMEAVVQAAEGRPVTYFGARHWHFEEDALIAKAAYQGGAVGTSTDIGALQFSGEGEGTIPHALENAYAAVYGKKRAVLEATCAFDRVIASNVPRIALIDYNNSEIDDTIAVADSLGAKLQAVRVDTPGENLAQGALLSPHSVQAQLWRELGIPIVANDHPDAKYWYGNGVTVTGVYALRRALDAAGRKEVQIVLTSGFGDPEKVRAFVRAEKILKTQLFDRLGVGGIYPSRSATMDVVSVKHPEVWVLPLSKTGRKYQPNQRLELVLGDKGLQNS